MRYLVTGVSGFVGLHLVPYLIAKGHDVCGVDAVPLSDAFCKTVASPFSFYQMSLMDQNALYKMITDVTPERIIHLASASSVGASWQKPVDCFTNNTNIFLNLIEAVRLGKVPCRILSVGSSEEYGPVTAADLPLCEDRVVAPSSPYAVARVAQEHLSKVYVKGYGLDIICTRSFNHLGRGQSDRFVMGSFIRQAMDVAKGKKPWIICGELNIVRDFSDVRDVIRAYDLLLEKGISGEIYNVCSGRGVTLREVLERICRKVGILPEFTVDPSLIRPVENAVIVGSNEKLLRMGFTPTYSLDQAIDDMICDRS